MTRLFGTDGVRGVANEELTPMLAMQLGQAGAYVLTKENHHKYSFLKLLGHQLQLCKLEHSCHEQIQAKSSALCQHFPDQQFIQYQYSQPCSFDRVLLKNYLLLHQSCLPVFQYILQVQVDQI